jgi:hypothetical protein
MDQSLLFPESGPILCSNTIKNSKEQSRTTKKGPKNGTRTSWTPISGQFLVHTIKNAFLRYNLHALPARVNSQMCNCANGHGVSDTAIG